MSSNQWSGQILKILDKAASDYTFPMLDNMSIYNAGIRMSVFRSEEEWLIIFEMINYIKSHEFVNEITAYGNFIQNNNDTFMKDFITPINGGRFWDDNGRFLIDKFRFSVNIYGEKNDFEIDKKDYDDAGIDLINENLSPVQILRIISYIQKDNVFLRSEDLLGICGRKSCGLHLFLRADEWYHPDIADDQLPSDNPCFLSLSQALAQDNSALYSCDGNVPNTHWSYWEIDDDRGWY